MTLSGINARELAERANVGRSFVYDILNGKSTNPTSQKLAAVADVLHVSVPYLLTGDESFTLATGDTHTASSGGAHIATIPSIAIESSKGGSTVITDDAAEKAYSFHESWLKEELGVNSKDLRVIYVRGDSMQPTLQENDMVLVNTTHKTPSPAGIFVLFDGIGLMIKRLEFASKDPSDTTPMVRILSDNPQYGQYERPLSEINIVGRIIWYSRTLK